jgi:hypothetical protein
LDFKLDIERDRIWMPVEAERDLYRRDLIYLLHPPVSAGFCLRVVGERGHARRCLTVKLVC